jgi:hypothetical protein
VLSRAGVEVLVHGLLLPVLHMQVGATAGGGGCCLGNGCLVLACCGRAGGDNAVCLPPGLVIQAAVSPTVSSA